MKIESKSAIICATLYVSVISALTVVRQQIICYKYLFVTNSPGLPSVFQDQQIIIIIIIIIIVINTIITM